MRVEDLPRLASDNAADRKWKRFVRANGKLRAAQALLPVARRHVDRYSELSLAALNQEHRFVDPSVAASTLNEILEAIERWIDDPSVENRGEVASRTPDSWYPLEGGRVPIAANCFRVFEGLVNIVLSSDHFEKHFILAARFATEIPIQDLDRQLRSAYEESASHEQNTSG